MCSIDNEIVSSPDSRVGSGIVGNRANGVYTVTEIDDGQLDQSVFDSLVIGQMQGNYFFQGDIKSLVISEKPSASNRQKITQYLAEIAGVTL